MRTGFNLANRVRFQEIYYVSNFIVVPRQRRSNEKDTKSERKELPTQTLASSRRGVSL